MALRKFPLRGRKKPQKVNTTPHQHTHKKRVEKPQQPFDTSLESDKIKLDTLVSSDISIDNINTDIPQELLEELQYPVTVEVPSEKKEKNVLTSDEKNSILDTKEDEKLKKKKRSYKRKKKVEPTTVKDIVDV